MMYPASKLGDTITGTDLHDVMGATPSPAGPVPTPVPKFPHPFTGSTSLWQSPKWPMVNVFVNGTPAATVGCKAMSAHTPPILPPPVVFVSWLPPMQITPKWFLNNLKTMKLLIGFKALFAQLQASGDVQQNVQGVLPPVVLPVAEGNIAIGSSTVTINGAPMALVGPMFACSCTTPPASLSPNATVIGSSNVMVGE